MIIKIEKPDQTETKTSKPDVWWEHKTDCGNQTCETISS